MTEPSDNRAILSVARGEAAYRGSERDANAVAALLEEAAGYDAWVKSAGGQSLTGTDTAKLVAVVSASATPRTSAGHTTSYRPDGRYGSAPDARQEFV